MSVPKPSPLEDLGLDQDTMAHLDLDKPVSRGELIRSLLAVHEVAFSQVQLLQIVAALNPNIPVELRNAAFNSSGNLLKFSAQMIRDWRDEDAA